MFVDFIASPQDCVGSRIRTVQDWPEPRVKFRDLTSPRENPRVCRMTIDELQKLCRSAMLKSLVLVRLAVLDHAPT